MKISVIIPPIFSITSLNHIIENVSKQTYSNNEVFITYEQGNEYNIVNEFTNTVPWIKFIKIDSKQSDPIFQVLHSTTGDLFAIIDCLDDFHPDKFKLHVELFSSNAAIGGILNGFARIDSESVVYSLKAAQPVIDLADIFSGEAIHFSDGIFRREWIENFFSDDSSYAFCPISSLSQNFYAHSYLGGCQIIGLNKAVNIRHKTIEENLDLKSAAESSILCTESLFTNSAFASSIAKWRETTLAQDYLRWSIQAFGNQETELGQELFRKSILLNRSILDIGARSYFSFLVKYAIQSGDAIDKFVKENINQLSPEFAWMSQYLNESIARGYFYKAVNEILFGRIDSAYASITQAKNYGTNLQKSDLTEALNILAAHEQVYGLDKMRPCIKELMLLSKYVEPKDIRWLISTWLINHAFAGYREQRYSVVPQGVVQAILTSPGHAFNPGVASIFFKSLIFIIKGHFPRKPNKLGRLNNSQV